MSQGVQKEGKLNLGRFCPGHSGSEREQLSEHCAEVIAHPRKSRKELRVLVPALLQPQGSTGPALPKGRCPLGREEEESHSFSSFKNFFYLS